MIRVDTGLVFATQEGIEVIDEKTIDEFSDALLGALHDQQLALSGTLF